MASRNFRPKRARWRSERGAVALTNGVVVAVVIVAGLVSVSLLARTARAANRINHKAENIAKTGQGINTATDSVIQLNRTNETASSILNSAKPLEGKLAQVITLAQSVDGLAKSINGTAGTINATAGASNSQAAAILDVAKRINNDVAQINTNLDGTISVANTIKGDTANILAEAKAAERYARCIDQRVPPAAPAVCN